MTAKTTLAELQQWADDLYTCTRDRVRENPDHTNALRKQIVDVLVGNASGADIFALVAWLIDHIERQHEIPATVQLAALARREGIQLMIANAPHKPKAGEQLS